MELFVAVRAISREISDELRRVEDNLTQHLSTRRQSVDQRYINARTADDWTWSASMAGTVEGEDPA